MTREERWAIESIIHRLYFDTIKVKHECDMAILQRGNTIMAFADLEKANDEIETLNNQAIERVRRVWKAQGDTAKLEDIEKECFNYGPEDKN